MTLLDKAKADLETAKRMLPSGEDDVFIDISMTAPREGACSAPPPLPEKVEDQHKTGRM